MKTKQSTYPIFGRIGDRIFGPISGIAESWKTFAMLVIVVCLAAAIGSAPVYASCIDLDDVPLDTQEQEAPGIVMFVIDDSGSMDWEFICRGQTDGKFRGNIEYLFANPGDNVYSSYDSNGTILEGSSYANYWQSQWAGHNRLYYDPTAYYAPWPMFSNADPNNPRSNPDVAGNTLNLNATYYDFGGGGGLTTQDILDNGGVIVDNSDTSSTGPTSGLIIDNNGPESPASGSFDTAGSSYNAWGTSSASSDNGSNYLYSANSYRWCYGNWHYTNLSAGNYDVFVWYVESSNRGTAINYKVYNAGGAEVASHDFNQRDNGGQWNLLASDVYLDGSASVQLRHYCTSTYSNRACADAVMLVPKFTNSVDVLFEQSYGWASATSAYGYYGDDYLYSNAGYRTYTATWTANNLDTSETYDVYARWGSNSSRSTDVHYKTYDDTLEIADTGVNQRENGGEWVLVAQNVSFSSGIGKVELNEYGTYSNFSADAVAFMPAISITAPLNLIRAHYYVVSGGITYLVNLDGGFQYYEVEHYTNTENIDNLSELINLSPSEAETAGIVTGRTYAEERQNFANWYSFYRKRELTAKNAIAKVIDEIQGVYIGLHYINSGLGSIARPVRVTLNDVLYDESVDLLNILYNDNSYGSTPLRNGLYNIGRYFQGEFGKPTTMPSTNFSSVSFPYFTADKGGSCQQSFAIVMTDGYWNGSHYTVGNADGNGDTFFDGFPYGDTVSNTLADVAMYFYEHDLKSDLNDDVPINSVDQAEHQHLVTYTLSFGVDGTIDQSLYPNCVSGGACPSPWPDPFDGNLEKIDDMYHAAVNGRGKYVNAASPQEMVDAMNDLKQDIISRLGSSASLATNSIQRQVGTVIYQGTYNTAGWTGEVKALEVRPEDGSVNTANPIWSTSDDGSIPDWDARQIISFNGTSSIDFFAANLTASQQALLANNGHDVSDLVNFIRGDTSQNLTHGGPFRVRTSPIGDIVHSAPTYYKGVIYIGANDGMLHALNAVTGQEIFSYVPNMVYDHLSDLALPGYSHRYYVDSTPVTVQVGSQDILVGGLGKGGKGYFGLDITNPSEPSALWEYTSDDDLGYSFSRANIIKTQALGYVAIFGNGYDSVNEDAVLFLLSDITSDAPVVTKLDTGVGGCNGLSTPSAVDVDADGYADFVYAGDLLGNMWKFDIRGDVADWKVYYNDGAPQPLITVRNTADFIQPITAAPEVMLDCAKSDWSKGGAGLMVIFATGRYLNSDDFDDVTTQSFYGIWDWGDIWEEKSGYTVAKEKYWGRWALTGPCPM